MSEHEGEDGGGESRALDAAAGGVLHPRSFKLRFAVVSEPGRSNLSAVKPLGLPAIVTGKFYSRAERECQEHKEGVERALVRIRRMFENKPHVQLTSAYEYGKYAHRAPPPSTDRRLDHRIRDSAWLKARMAVLAADDKLKHH